MSNINEFVIFLLGTFYSKVQSQDKLKKHAFSSKMINEQSLINLNKNDPNPIFILCF